MGFSSITGDETIMFADNASFDGTQRGGKITTDGQMWIGSTASPHVKVGSLTSSDSSITWTFGSGTISGTIAGGSTVGKTITGDDGVVLSPVAGNWFIRGSGSTVTSGSGNTLVTKLQGLTNHALLVGAGTDTITKIAATANTGAVLQNNSGADPSYSTATYPSTTTANQILYSSATNVVNQITAAANGVLVTSNANVPSLLANGTAGQVLTANSGAPPSWQTNPALAIQVVIQAFTATGAFTYTPTTGMQYVIVELVGAGGGSGGVDNTIGNIAISGAGGGGGYARFLLTAAQVGASKMGSVGVGGTGGAAGNNNGGNGGDTTLATASAWTAGGGGLGAGSAASTTATPNGGAAGVVTTGTGSILMTTNGLPADSGWGFFAAAICQSGRGGSTILGFGGVPQLTVAANTNHNGDTGRGYGGGASGAFSYGTAGNAAGAAGANGIAIFTEYL